MSRPRPDLLKALTVPMPDKNPSPPTAAATRYHIYVLPLARPSELTAYTQNPTPYDTLMPWEMPITLFVTLWACPAGQPLQDDIPAAEQAVGGRRCYGGLWIATVDEHEKDAVLAHANSVLGTPKPGIGIPDKTALALCPDLLIRLCTHTARRVIHVLKLPALIPDSFACACDEEWRLPALLVCMIEQSEKDGRPLILSIEDVASNDTLWNKLNQIMYSIGEVKDEDIDAGTQDGHYAPFAFGEKSSDTPNSWHATRLPERPSPQASSRIPDQCCPCYGKEEREIDVTGQSNESVPTCSFSPPLHAVGPYLYSHELLPICRASRCSSDAYSAQIEHAFRERNEDTIRHTTPPMWRSHLQNPRTATHSTAQPESKALSPYQD
ncbi:hypothetical protein K466DRAFT_569643 [Polyporus arcularius HHB13444]|uniref:Uncharacterized protein n=1 Tax=Polyporus arcularius HHB13444 TaxID=1314778 RepID=A0A5C3NSY5_9APHY|nr:hypothetical protein K466DRAFT_569643 [Polyporus arcularius HHB13444]